jgi:hypothetical protein
METKNTNETGLDPKKDTKKFEKFFKGIKTSFIDGQFYKFNRDYKPDKKDLKFLSKKTKNMKESVLIGKLLSVASLNDENTLGADSLSDRRMSHFFDVYDGLNLDRDKEYSFLEIGNRWAGALWGWRIYLPESKIYGLDIDPKTQQFATGDAKNGVKIYEGSQTDVELLKKIHKDAGKLDIVVDDGGHTMTQIKTSFETLWPLLEDGGIYVIEDIQCCYWPKFEGKYKGETSFIELIKSFVDNIHSCYYKKNGQQSKRAESELIDEKPSYYDLSIQSVEIYDSVAVIRKKVKSELEPISPEANLLQEVRNNMMVYDVKEVHQKLGVGISLSEDELQKYSEFLIRVDQDYVNFVNKKLVTVESEGWWNE